MHIALGKLEITIVYNDRKKQILALMRQGKKINAIKEYREMCPGTSLKEAKDVIDSWYNIPESWR